MNIQLARPPPNMIRSIRTIVYTSVCPISLVKFDIVSGTMKIGQDFLDIQYELVAEGLDADTLSKLYTRYLPDFLLFGYDITPLEDMIRHGTHILDDNSQIGAYVGSNFCYLICLRQLIRSRKERPVFRYVCTTCSELPYIISTL